MCAKHAWCCTMVHAWCQLAAHVLAIEATSPWDNSNILKKEAACTERERERQREIGGDNNRGESCNIHNSMPTWHCMAPLGYQAWHLHGGSMAVEAKSGSHWPQFQHGWRDENTVGSSAHMMKALTSILDNHLFVETLQMKFNYANKMMAECTCIMEFICTSERSTIIC